MRRPCLSLTTPALSRVRALHNSYMRYVNFLFDTYYNILYTYSMLILYYIIAMFCSTEVARE